MKPQIGSRWRIRFRTLPWTVDLWRGLLTRNIRFWGCLWTVDSWRGRRVRNHWSSRFLIRCRPHGRKKVPQRRSQSGSRRRIQFLKFPGRSTYGGDYLPRAFGSGVSLDSGLMEGTSSPEPLEQLVLNTLLVERPMERYT